MDAIWSAIARGAALALALWAGTASAQVSACNAYTALASALAGMYGEAVTARGEVRGNVIELWVNAETRTWSITVVDPNGIACIVANGDRWTGVGQQEKGQPL